jgi:DNA polymerase-3 subunit alpha
MAGFRPGGTPLRIDLVTEGTRGTIELNGAASLRSDAELIAGLRALPGVSQVTLSMHRPWAS